MKRTWRSIRAGQIRLALVPVLLALHLGGCVTPLPTTEKPPAGFPVSSAALADGQPGSSYTIDTASSEIRIRAYRGGRLARFGHSHVISSRDIHGFVFLGEQNDQSKLALYLPLASLIVDDAALRQVAGADFDTRPSAADIQGTHSNMLGEKVLNASTYPFLVIHGLLESGTPPAIRISASINLHGEVKTRLIPVEVGVGQDRLTASGSFFVRQSEFGITPFSVLGDALRVKDRLEIDFDIVARKD